MATIWLKRAVKTAQEDAREAEPVVREILARIKAEGEDTARAYAVELDGWTGEIIVPPEAIADAAVRVPEKVKEDLRFAHENVRRFAEMQRATFSDSEIEVIPGLRAGQ